MKAFVVVAGLVAVAVLVQSVKANLHCKNKEGEDVDWYLILKFPGYNVKSQQVKNLFNGNGVRYVYLDSETKNFSYWNLDPASLNRSDTALGYTLDPIFKKPRSQNVAYLTYNDQPVETSEEGQRYRETMGPDQKKHYAHSKGIFMADLNSAVMLLHSVPQFPEDVHTGTFRLPPTARRYGQLFLCITFANTQVEKIAKHLKNQGISIHHSFGPDSVTRKYPTLRELIITRSFEPGTSVTTTVLESKGGRNFTAISKPGTAVKDVYEDEVVALARDDIFVESWRNGHHMGGRLLPKCDSYKVQDITKLRFYFNSTSFTEYASREDHSKYAVAQNKTMFCGSSLNRERTQYTKGGELFCMSHPALSKLVRNSIQETESCNGKWPKPAPPKFTTRKPWSPPPKKVTMTTKKSTKATRKPRSTSKSYRRSTKNKKSLRA